MGWFENQIEERRQRDQQLLEDSFVKAAGVVLGQRQAEKMKDQRIITKTAIDDILKYYHFKPVDLPDSIKSLPDQLDYCLRPYGMMYRDVELTKGWYKDAYGPLLAFLREGSIPVALLPGRVHGVGYTYLDPETGKWQKINRTTAALFDTEAFCFYCPLPQKKLGIPDLILYMRRCISVSDMTALVLATLAVTLVGMIIPRIIKTLTGPVLMSGHAAPLAGISISILCVALSSQLINSTRGLVLTRINLKTSLAVQASMMLRLMSLPADFFRKYTPGELRSRSMSVNQLCTLLLNMVLGTGLSSLASLLYITQIFRFAPALVFPSLAVILLTVVVSLLTVYLQVGIDRRRMEEEAKESGLTYALITGIQKIKLAGAEKRVFAKWLGQFAGVAELTYNPPLFLKINSVINTTIGLFSNIVLYILAIKSQVDPSSYYAFTASYGMVMGAFLSMSDIALSAARIRPILHMAEPFLHTEPETSETREIVTQLSGRIELDHVFFRYSDDSPYILEDLSLKIRPGEYLAIVGTTGCGKSTLFRLLLGFEKPQKGAVLYDGKNMESLDLPSLRKKIGTVLQDAGLFQGDIYSNIVISAPELSLEEAWEAAEKAGIADEIRAMPMGMHTILSEGQGGISGGQRQRIMIARAIAPKPKLLLFDEATSALDNRTQQQVSDSLDAMGCTRIVIAHRLSTIRHCDRILVLDQGRIIEEGTYEELVELGGFFASLVERQRI